MRRVRSSEATNLVAKPCLEAFQLSKSASSADARYKNDWSPRAGGLSVMPLGIGWCDYFLILRTRNFPQTGERDGSFRHSVSINFAKAKRSDEPNNGVGSRCKE